MAAARSLLDLGLSVVAADALGVDTSRGERRQPRGALPLPRQRPPHRQGRGEPRRCRTARVRHRLYAAPVRGTRRLAGQAARPGAVTVRYGRKIGTGRPGR